MRLLPARLVETIVPARLGRSFRWLLGAALVNNVGDGIALAAGPLLVASQTRDPFLVSLAVTARYVPFVLFGVLGGTAADRFDRKKMVVTVNAVRAGVLLVLVTTIVTGSVNILAVLAALFALATAEVFADSASNTLMPSIVARQDLGVANARMQGAFLLTNQLLTPPIGAFLFAAGMALPFATNAACFALGAVLITRVVVSTSPRRTIERTSWTRDMAEGIRWLLHHAPMRTLTVTIFTFNVTYGAAWGVLVLYALERLGMNEVGFGFVTTAIAIGGVIGTASYGWLERHFALGDIMRVGLVIETVTHLVFAVNTLPGVALGTLVVFGAHAFVWGTTSEVVRQRAVPNELLGRVAGVYRVAITGGMALGVPLGGVLAASFGITAPYWFAFAGSAILVVVLWREFAHIAHAAEP